MGKRDKGRLPPFVPLLVETLDSRAWRATSHGAKALYVVLKREVANGRNRAYVSSRIAQRKLQSHRSKVREWFAELEHYGFIKLAAAGCLGVDGKGKAPHWTLTELGNTSKASANGLLEPPSRDFMRWDGVLFDPKPYRLAPGLARLQKQNPGTDACTTLVQTHVPPLVQTHVPLKLEGGTDACAIEASEGGTDACAITSINHYCGFSAPASHSPPLPSDGSLEEKNTVALLAEENNVVQFDERIAALEATEKRRKLK